MGVAQQEAVPGLAIVVVEPKDLRSLLLSTIQLPLQCLFLGDVCPPESLTGLMHLLVPLVGET